MSEQPTQPSEPLIRISERAQRKIAELVAAEGRQDMLFRIAVSAGGCSGFQYGFSLDDGYGCDDRLFTAGDVTLVVDETSLGLLAGAELDYVDELIGARFALTNPNASARCGCGASFAV